MKLYKKIASFVLAAGVFFSSSVYADTVKIAFIDPLSGPFATTGTIAGALKIPRGFIEFAADDSTPFHNKALSKDQEIILVCGAGGMAALTGKTMMEMGYTNIKNVGGIGDWIKAEGPLEE